MAKVIDLTGQRFGRLMVMHRIGGRSWSCHCDCGKQRAFKSDNLRRGLTRSCGCLRTELLVCRSVLHGHYTENYKSPTYQSWAAMIQRCENGNHNSFARYGGRGVSICERWRDDFKDFLQDMGPRQNGHTLDRIDNDRGYEPSNCRWATYRTQRLNQRAVA